MYTPPAPEQHDTTAIPRPYPPTAPGYAPGYGPGMAQGPGSAPGYDPGMTQGPGFAPGYGPGYVPGNPAADAWEAKYRHQRTRTRVAVTVAGLMSVLAVVLGVSAWQLSQANPLISAASDLAKGLGGGQLNLDGIAPPATTPDGATPNGTPPDATTPGAPDAQAPNNLDMPLSDLPLPDGLKSLASTLGISDVGQLLDMAVANGIMTQEDADNLRTAIAAGSLAQGLTQSPQQ